MRRLAIFALLLVVMVAATVLVGRALDAEADVSCAQPCLSRVQWTTPYEQQQREQQQRYNREWQERNEEQQRRLQDQKDRLNQGSRGGSGGSYGALAYSPKTGDYGYSYGYGSRPEVEKRAKRECGQNDCEIAAWYSQACGAIATGGEGKWGGGSGDTEHEAREDAKNDCVKEGGKNCEILVAKCTR